MSEQIKTATFVRDVTKQNGARGEQRLYLVTPPMVDTSWGDTEVTEYSHVIVSAVDVLFSGPETYIFPANADGSIAAWGELHGSFQGALNHDQALTNAGYALADVVVVAEGTPRKGIEG